MRFSERFSIVRENLGEWFDPVLTVDTGLFIDPFLLYAQEDIADEFVGSHAEIIGFFEHVYKLIAVAHGNRHTNEFRSALNLLLFPEVAEVCLGYTAAGVRGSGSGREVASEMATGIETAISVGITDISRFEQVAILGARVGPDRISDITAGLLRHRFFSYTARLAEELGLPTERVRHPRGRFDTAHGLWLPIEAKLPINPYPRPRQPVLLVPRAYLRELPVLTPEDFWSYTYDLDYALLSKEFGEDISRRVDKRTIVSLATRHPEILKRYIKAADQREEEPYDLGVDPALVDKWYDIAKAYAAAQPLAAEVKTKRDFIAVVERFVNAYKHFVEQQKGWEILQLGGEKIAQRLFLGVVLHYCIANNIDISPEANI